MSVHSNSLEEEGYYVVPRDAAKFARELQGISRDEARKAYETWDARFKTERVNPEQGEPLGS